MIFSFSLCLTLTLVILSSFIPSSSTTNSSSCNSSTKEQSLSREDYKNMAHFVVHFMHDMEANEVFLCGEEKGNAFVEKIFLTTMTKEYIYFLPCDDKKLQNHVTRSLISKKNSAEAAGDAVVHKSTNLPAVVQVVKCSEMQRAVKQARHYSSITEGRVVNIIIGADLPTNTVFDPGIATWYQAHYNKAKEEVAVYESFLFEDTGSSLNVRVGIWTWDNLTMFRETGEGPQNFNGHSVNVVAFPLKPYVFQAPACVNEEGLHSMLPSNNCSASEQVRMQDNITGVYYTGYLIQVFQTIATALNFKVNLTIVPDLSERIFGIISRRNSIINATGLVGYLQRKQACIALGTFTMTKDRLDVMDFSRVVDFGSNVLYVRTNSSSAEFGWFTYTSGFHWLCYVAILGLVCIVTLGLLLIARVDPSEDAHFSFIGNVSFLLFSCLMQQGSWILPRTILSQFVLISFWFASIVTYAHYSGIIFSSLTVARSTLPFNSLEEAMNNDDWNIGLLKGTTVPDLLKGKKNDGKYEKIATKLENNPSLLVDTESLGIDRVLNEDRFAFLNEKPSTEAIIDGNCNITQIPGEYLEGYLNLGFLKGLPFAQVINNELTKAHMGGLLDRLKKIWWNKQSSCEVPLPYKPLDFRDIFTAFLVIVVSWIISLTFLAMEILYYRHKKGSPMHDNTDMNQIIIGTPIKYNEMYPSGYYNSLEQERSITTGTSTQSKREITLKALDEYILSNQK